LAKIVVDSGCDVPTDLQAWVQGVPLQSVPLTLSLDGNDYIDDEHLDVTDYLIKTEESSQLPTTSAPSPQRYLDAIEGSESVFVVTLSSKLSASFESACLAARIWSDQFKDSLVHVFDSLSASAGETLIAMKIAELVQRRLPDQEVIEHVESFIGNMQTYFILDRYDTLIKSGRITKTVATMADVLKIKPICAGIDGEMAVVGKARGYPKAIVQLMKMIKSQAVDFSERVLAISHCACPEKAEETQRQIMGEIPFKDSFITTTTGLCTTYTARGGIVIAY